MRILVLTTSFPRSESDDAGIFVYRLVEALAQRGAAGSVLVPKDIESETLLAVKSFLIERFRYGVFRRGMLAFGAGIMPNLKRDWLLSAQIPTFILFYLLAAVRRAKTHQVIYAQWIISGLVAWGCSLLIRLPYVVTLRGEDVRLLRNPLFRHIFMPSLRGAVRVVAVSQSLKNEVIALTGLDPDYVTIVPNGVEICGDVGSLESVLPSAPFLVFVGSVIPRKRVSVLLQILAQPVLDGFHLVICGRTDDVSELQRLRHAAQDLNLGSRVHFLGAVAPESIGSALRRAAAYVSASEYEGRPNAVLEALAVGTPVFLSDITSHRELVEDGISGFLFSTDDVARAARLISDLLSNKSWKREVVARGHVLTAELTWERCAESYLSLYSAS